MAGMDEVEITTSYQRTKVTKPFESARPQVSIKRKVSVALSQRDFDLSKEIKKDFTLCKKLIREELEKVEESETNIAPSV